MKMVVVSSPKSESGKTTIAALIARLVLKEEKVFYGELLLKNRKQPESFPKELLGKNSELVDLSDISFKNSDLSDNDTKIQADNFFNKCMKNLPVKSSDGVFIVEFGFKDMQILENHDGSQMQCVSVLTYDNIFCDIDKLKEVLKNISAKNIVINKVPKYRVKTLEQIIFKLKDKIQNIVIIPDYDCFSSLTIGEIAKGLNAEWILGEGNDDVLIRNFLIGGNPMDKAVDYFARIKDKAVITRADRPDIQMACLATQTKCLILTGGNDPIEYVQHEAQKNGVVVLKVNCDTIETVSRLEEIIDSSNILHKEKIDEFVQEIPISEKSILFEKLLC